jgi:hypothetical protein
MEMVDEKRKAQRRIRIWKSKYWVLAVQNVSRPRRTSKKPFRKPVLRPGWIR